MAMFEALLMAQSAINGYNVLRSIGVRTVKTIYDLVTMVIFAGLVVLFLQRSTAAEPRDHMYQYAPPAIGCAVAHYLGNHGQDWVAVGIIVAVVGYILYVLKPFNQTL